MAVAAPDDEALCRRCGISCHLAVVVNGVPLVVPGLHCRHLRELGRGQFSCDIYDQRHALAPWCMTAVEAAPQGFLARDCPYGLRSGARQGKVRAGARAMLPLWPAVLAEIAREGLPSWVDTDALQRTWRTHGGPNMRLVADPDAPDRLRVERVESGVAP